MFKTVHLNIGSRIAAGEVPIGPLPPLARSRSVASAARRVEHRSTNAGRAGAATGGVAGWPPAMATADRPSAAAACQWVEPYQSIGLMR